MVWKIEFSTLALKNLNKLDPQIARRILIFLNEKITTLNNPRDIGEALKGSRLGEFWKYRVGDYRIISSIQDEVLCVLILKIGHRSKIYKA